MSRLLGGVASIVILAACGTLVHATPYYGAISVNFSTAVTNPSDAYYAQPSNWNNLDPGFGATTNLLDNAGATVAGISIQRTAGGETDVASIVGNTGQSLSSGQPGNVTYVSGQVGFNGMVNAADPFDGGGPTSFTITGIPYSS